MKALALGARRGARRPGGALGARGGRGGGRAARPRAAARRDRVGSRPLRLRLARGSHAGPRLQGPAAQRIGRGASLAPICPQRRFRKTPRIPQSAAIEDLTRNAVDVLPAGGLEEKLKLGRPLRVKFGIDVTAPDVHIGNAIPLQRMRAFQDAGHLGVLIIGDYTTRIGDPSGRSAERPILSPEEIDRNAQTYLAQAGKVIDLDRTEVRFNGEWLAKLDFAEVLRITRTLTVAQLLERDDFANRFAAREPISVSELLYPLMQGYDSVAVEADVELGGTDQLYNLLAGRALQRPTARAADRAHDPAHPWLRRGEDERVEKQLRRAGRAARGAVRQGDAHLRRAAPRLLQARAAAESPPASRWTQSSRSHAGSRPLARRRGGDARPRRTSRASCGRDRRPRTCRPPRCRTAIPCTCRRRSQPRSDSRRARRGA